jgi:[ribosomal protein S18]-alanine N-acetyltransferase
MTRIAGVSVNGRWPGPVVLRSGWAKASARPWNDTDPRASIRFERGSADFLRSAALALCELGAPAVLSAPVHRTGMGIWERAGFEPYRQLLLMEARLGRDIPDPGPVARAVRVDDIAPIDAAAFDPEWRIGRLGLADALSATPQSIILTVGDPPAGFAIVGVTALTGYLQRLAVDPARQGEGAGRRLLRAAMRWARGSGARSMLLNTQLDNERAAALYRSDGFQTLGDRLTVLRAGSAAATGGES